MPPEGIEPSRVSAESTPIPGRLRPALVAIDTASRNWRVSFLKKAAVATTPPPSPRRFEAFSKKKLNSKNEKTSRFFFHAIFLGLKSVKKKRKKSNVFRA